MCINGIAEMVTVLSLVNRYQRVYPFLEYDEILSVAAVTAVEAEKKWNPTKGVKRSTYVYAAVNNALKKERRRIRQLYDFELPLALLVGTTLRDLSKTVIVEQAMDQSMMWQRLYYHILSQSSGEAARMVLLEGSTVAEASAATCVEPRVIRNSTRRARRSIRRDTVLRDYVRSLP